MAAVRGKGHLDPAVPAVAAVEVPTVPEAAVDPVAQAVAVPDRAAGVPVVPEAAVDPVAQAVAVPAVPDRAAEVPAATNKMNNLIKFTLGKSLVHLLVIVLRRRRCDHM